MSRPRSTFVPVAVPDPVTRSDLAAVPDPVAVPVAVPVLEEARRLSEPAIRAGLDRLDPDTRHACGYHLGYWDADGSPLDAGGKGVRPALAVLSARAAGSVRASDSGTQDGVVAAAACELVHNFSLLHDDLMDGDTERRHRTTVWARFGPATAILAGDAMLALANELLAEAGSPATPAALRYLNMTTRRLVKGQAADLAFETRVRVSLEECLRMAGDKTGALLACSASLGAMLAGAPSRTTTALGEYGAHLGLAFQLIDDLLGIWGTPARTGKPVWSDLRARKKSLPVVVALASDCTAGRALRRMYAEETLEDDAALAELANLVERAGGRAWTEERAERESAAAVAALDGLDVPASVCAQLAALAELLCRRTY
ncbi:polyprenyl synthetase family protein [Actinopolymorpha rutila]|uniref:Geranylgeranyl diphosphate synthase type I n=1 Tax=Actinopolymorpha rutila TaxID=446787 RepID=A0A852ZGV0_9ACTN|nr:polyprenyl synthetase family protein [Actinopolymorpha rutila]NYH91385.1 geranylgeranyl diphosphate synthase type I [Actinopolymorpha rutila]